MNAQDNPYPALYHCHHKNVTEDLPFWQTLARWQGDPVLELGCGTGRVLNVASIAAFQPIPMLATKGRASYLGERSIGHQDPGATSSYLMLKTAAETIGVS